MPLPKVSAKCEKQTISSRIWTRVTEFMFYNDNRYTVSALHSFISIYLSLYLSMLLSSLTITLYEVTLAVIYSA